MTLDTTLPPTALVSGLPFLSLPARLELLFLRLDRRRLVRIGVPAARVDELASALRAHGLFMHRWRFAIESQPSATIDSFRIGGRLVPAGASARAVVFVARDPAAFDGVDAFALDDWFLGIALDYPACCIESFVAAPSLASSFDTLADRFDAEPGPFPYWANVLVEVFGFALVSHLPCAPWCEATSDLALANLECLAAHEPIVAARLVGAMRTTTLYDPGLGVLASPEPFAGPVALSSVLATSGWHGYAGPSSSIVVRRRGLGAADVAPAGGSASRTVRCLDFTAGREDR